MLFQQEMKLSIDSETMSSGNSEDAAEMLCTSNDDEESVDKIVEQLLVNRQQVFQTVSDNIKVAQHTQKQQYDKKHVPKELKVGTEVWLKALLKKIKKRKGGTFEDSFKGPFTIHKYIGKGKYQVKNSRAILQKKINIS